MYSIGYTLIEHDIYIYALNLKTNKFFYIYEIIDIINIIEDNWLSI